MALRIAIFSKIDPSKKLDLSHPELGNPGVGGAQYAMATLAHYLKVHYGAAVEPFLYTTADLAYSRLCVKVLVKDEFEALEKAKADHCEAFVLWPDDNVTVPVMERADALGLNVVIWAHNHLSDVRNRIFAKAACVKKVVCVGENQWGLLSGTPVFPKATCIFYGLDASTYDSTPLEKEPFSLTYLGTLIPAKGFHFVAAIWKPVLNAFPQARLHVIGSSTHYGGAVELGPLGLAERHFEEQVILPFLTEGGKLLPSVSFHGCIGAEKFEIMRRSQVGVVNPTGVSETFSLSAAEFQACGIPVLAFNGLGFLDTVIDEHTGLLSRDPKELANNCATLFRNPARALAMGRNGSEFVRRKFAYAGVCRKWLELFEELRVTSRP